VQIATIYFTGFTIKSIMLLINSILLNHGVNLVIVSVCKVKFLLISLKA